MASLLCLGCLSGCFASSSWMLVCFVLVGSLVLYVSRRFAGRPSSSCLLRSLLLNRVSNWFACLVDPLKFTVHEGQKM